ncbi:outer membrane lipoprotein-sorting protein [Methylacidimicrobium sp. B4]|uniref:outer membrane lipoprotein-sorting protein n=1 Tax=Methylacidimicrobium sp. B4 TaxID=2796139 RepID=UPI001A8EB705|nr:outer membrane lipoprotein-sorting protein [Methylacidimicrobium sp. B4]QSR85669.1 outer membrane lipoprotein-sorting protein [Methylacidimicrobium sp. B4]
MRRTADSNRSSRWSRSSAKAALALAGAFWLFALISPARSTPDPAKPGPPIEFLQGRFWKNFRLQDFALHGVIESERESYPIQLILHDRKMIYDFENPPFQIRVEIQPEQSIVERRRQKREPWQPVSGRARMSPILDTDITYEDLCLDFMRWERIRPLGTDHIKTLTAWAFDAVPPPGTSAYTKVRYWIAAEYYALLRADGYNGAGELIKRLEVNGVQRIGEAYVIKEMQVSSFDPKKESSSRTLINIRRGEALPPEARTVPSGTGARCPRTPGLASHLGN